MTISSRVFAGLVGLLLGGLLVSRGDGTELHPTPIQLHPDNPHYFLWRDKPTILITSGEHYGAVLNQDFDMLRYLDTLAADHLNLTRLFTGAVYVEPQGAFQIAKNTLAPAPTKFLAPWARSSEPGYAGGGSKFDLEQWNPAYFERLRQFVTEAARRGIIVEVNLFCPMYEDVQWSLSPFHASNNLQGLGTADRHGILSLDRSGPLLAYQERFVRKIVDELKAFDNVYYEITNEPYVCQVPSDWERHMVEVVVEAQRNMPHPQLISLNIANHQAEVVEPHPAVSIFNFHYASPPDTVWLNAKLGKVIGDNETGFRGTDDLPYRTEAWEFLLAGGGLFNHLDYSFAVGHEDGSFAYPPTQPGGGNAGFRRQMRVLRDFMESFEFIRFYPKKDLVERSEHPQATVQALTTNAGEFAFYLRRLGPGAEHVLVHLPRGSYQAHWVDPRTGDTRSERWDVTATPQRIPVPEYADDIAVRGGPIR